MEKIRLIVRMISYNLKIVFSGRFIYFLISAWLFYLVILGIMLFSRGAPEVEDIYNLLLFPGILIMFYPVVYNIQNDKDARMLEIVFGVPDYRYKVYALRFFIAMLLLVFLLLLMALVAWFSVVRIGILSMVVQLMSPLLFLACLTFLLTTIARSGNGAAVVVIIIGLIFFMLAEPLSKSKWNLFLNPFSVPVDMNLTIWKNVVHQNRLILGIGSIISLLWGLMNLQQREKFV
ncbi:MAG: hypothetical protein U0T82_10915 [Bacteroidales bacterium]